MNWINKLERYDRIEESAQNVKDLFEGEFVKPTTDLIPIRNNPEGNPTVNARDLHEFLEVGRDFSSWIKDRIEKYEFEEGLEFVVFTNSGENPLGGRPSIEYHLGLDMAKELSMIERTDKGREARKYFIQCEKIAKDKASAPRRSLVEQAEMFLQMAKEQERLIERQEIIDRKVKQLELNAKTEADYFTISAWANLINLKLPIELAYRLGKAAARLSRERDVPMGTAKHIRFGKVNTYHESILTAVMGVGDDV